MTIYEDAFLSLTDYLKSPAEVLFFPKATSQRQSEVWMRGDYELLSQAELDECVEIFLTAREIVRSQIVEEMEEAPRRARDDNDDPPDGGGGRLA